MKDIVLSRGDNRLDKQPDVRLQTRPSGDIEIVKSVTSEVGLNGGIVRPGHPTDQIIGVIPREKIADVVDFLTGVQ
jgi:hypothetical protein